MDDYTKKISVFEKVTSDNNAIRLVQIKIIIKIKSIWLCWIFYFDYDEPIDVWSFSPSDKLDADLRDIGKKVQKFENGIEETLENLQVSTSKLEEAEKEFKAELTNRLIGCYFWLVRNRKANSFSLSYPEIRRCTRIC